MTKAADLRALDVSDLRKKLVECRREMFNLRMQQASSGQAKTHRFGWCRREIARIQTILTERNKVDA